MVGRVAHLVTAVRVEGRAATKGSGCAEARWRASVSMASKAAWAVLPPLPASSTPRSSAVRPGRV